MARCRRENLIGEATQGLERRGKATARSGSPRLEPEVRRTFAALLLAMTIAAMDATIVATALPTIVGEMGALTLLPWVLTANVLASTITIPLYGNLSDLYGRRRLMGAALVLFAAGSCAASLSQGIEQLILFRVVQGAGSAGLLSLSFMIVGDIFTPRERGRYQGYISAVFAVASLCGPLVGGLAVDHLSWRAAFYPSVPLALVTFVVIRRNLANPPVARGVRIDWLGAVLLAVALTAFLLILTWGGREHGWTSPVILSTAAVGGLALAWFLRQERSVSNPILPLFLFLNREFSVGNVVGFVSGLGLFFPFAYLPVFLQISLGMSATLSGLVLFPMLGTAMVGSLVSGRILSRWGRYKGVVITGAVLLGIGLGLLSILTESTGLPAVAAAVAVFGFSLGVLIPVVVLVVQNAVDPAHMGVATASAQVFRQLGGTTGTALFGSLFNSRLAANLTAELPAGSPVRGLDVGELVSSPAIVATMEAPVRELIREAVAMSSGQMFRLAMPVAVAAAIAGLMLRGLPLRDVLPHQQPVPARSSEDAPPEPTPPFGGEGSGSADIE